MMDMSFQPAPCNVAMSSWPAASQVCQRRAKLWVKVEAGCRRHSEGPRKSRLPGEAPREASFAALAFQLII